MNIVSDIVLKNTETELTSIVKQFVSNSDENTAAQVAGEILASVDWSDSYLMHKGLYWMVKNYLLQKNML